MASTEQNINKISTSEELNISDRIVKYTQLNKIASLIFEETKMEIKKHLDEMFERAIFEKLENAAKIGNVSLIIKMREFQCEQYLECTRSGVYEQIQDYIKYYIKFIFENEKLIFSYELGKDNNYNFVTVSWK